MTIRKMISRGISALAGNAGFGIFPGAAAVDFGEIVIDGVPEKPDGATRIMSFNLRCANDPEGSIRNRSKIVKAIIDAYAPDSFGVQEANPMWLARLDPAFSDRYERVGQPRDKTGIFSEYSAVFYLRDKFNLLSEGTIWLSETPEVRYTKSFDSACYRVATWAVLENRETGRKYTHINTHLDHILEKTRVGQTKVLIEKFKELEKDGTVICTGDFNTYTDGEVYAEMLRVADDVKLTATNTDSGITFHDYGRIKDGSSPIDFIFTTKGVRAENYKIIRNTAKNMYPSDHYPIAADLIL